MLKYLMSIITLKKHIAYKYEIFNTMQEFHLRDLICLIVFLSQLHVETLYFRNEINSHIPS